MRRGSREDSQGNARARAATVTPTAILNRSCASWRERRCQIRGGVKGAWGPRGRTDGGRRRAARFASPQTEWTWRSWLTCFLSSLAAGALISSAVARAIIWSPRTVAAPGITNAAGPRGAGPATREEWPAGAALATNASFAPAARPTARRRAGSERATGLTPARMMDAMGVRCAGRGPTRHRQSRAGEVKRPPDIFSRNALGGLLLVRQRRKRPASHSLAISLRRRQSCREARPRLEMQDPRNADLKISHFMDFIVIPLQSPGESGAHRSVREKGQWHRSLHP